jgi:hypothetical protein
MELNSEYSKSLFDNKVRELAHYLYVLRGCQKGRSLDNWLEAEKRLKESLGSNRVSSAEQRQYLSN